MPGRDRQRIGVVMTLVGIQDVAAGVHQAGEENASVSVRLGKALIYMNEPRTVEHLAQAWTELQLTAPRVLPREFTPALVAPMRGMSEPGIVVNASGEPPAGASVIHPRGEFSYIRLQIGRLVFEVRDLGAYASSAGAFQQARDLVREAFPDHKPSSRRATVLQDVQRAFPNPRVGQGRRVAGSAQTVPRSPVPADRRITLVPVSGQGGLR